MVRLPIHLGRAVRGFGHQLPRTFFAHFVVIIKIGRQTITNYPATDPALLREQIAFYRARAPEYGRSGAYRDQFEVMKRILRRLGPFEQALELACGTGIWTGELVNVAQKVTAIDASPEMLELNRRNVASVKVSYLQTDLFEWQPETEYDFVFMAFWLSHVPPDLMDSFLGKVRASVHPGGGIFIVDQCEDFRDRPVPDRVGIRETRRAPDGRTFSIVKVYYHPALLAARFTHLGFDVTGERVGDSFFFISGTRVTA